MKNPANVSCETLSSLLLEYRFFSNTESSLSFSKDLVSYWNEFLNWNKTHNLSRITHPEEVLHLHFADSLFPVKFSDPFIKAKNVLDLGTGGGFHGIHLSLYFPSIDFPLMDLSRKKISFLKYVSSKLNFSNVFPVHNDFFKSDHSFDIIISRAVRIDSKIFSHASKCINKGGWLVVFRTKDDLPLLNSSPDYKVDYTILNKNRSILFYQF